MKATRRLVSLALVAAACGVGLPAHAADADAIRHVLMATFDKPEARLTVEPVVVRADHALAGWSQGERGGRAMLVRHHGQWQVVMCSGDGLKDAALLREAGVAPADATALVQALAAAEAALPSAHRARFSTFDGVLRLDAAGHHPPAGHAPAGHAPAGHAPAGHAHGG